MTSTKSTFVPLRRLKRMPDDPAATIAQIRKIYFRTTRQTIDHDLDEARDLLKSLPDEDARERATVFMHGLHEMRREWQKPKTSTVTKAPSRKASAKKGRAQNADTASARRRT